MQHTFHIPVLGLGYSIDTPLKVARYGISSVVSIVDDELTERMRKHHAEKNGEPYEFISKAETDSRARRITAYLNLLNHLVSKQITALKELSFEEKGNDLCTYFELLPEHSVLKAKYREMQQMPDSIEKLFCQKELKRQIKAGSIDVNIMSKVDKANFYQGQYLGDESTDALAAVRGFANSTLRSSVIISAGLNPRLFSYMEKIYDFLPSSEGTFAKKIILKVSDYRSALIQAKVLAKKGLWVSEFRIESGLNCGGHAFATEGFLLGPILEEFKENRTVLYNELHQLYTQAIISKNTGLSSCNPAQRITVQGGIGTAEEHRFLIQHFQLDSAGWGSPFLLVPEATNVDINTLNDLAASTESDFYLSHASPLGVPFNNFAKSTSEIQRLERIANGRPGSPCTKKFLCSNTEFTEQPICTASRKYQHLKIKQLQSLDMEETERTKQIDAVTEKICLCEGLCASAYLANDILKPRENKAVSICPGPNLAYFSKKYSLKEMIDHIYERCDLLVDVQRPNLFVKELGLYIDYLKKEFETLQDDLKKRNSLTRFYNQLQNGVNYYKAFIAKAEPSLSMWNTEQVQFFNNAVQKLLNLKIQYT
jgi:hypothetical protein